MSREIKFRVRNLNTGRVIGYETVSDGMWFISAKGQDWENGTYSPAEGVKLQREQYIGLKAKGVEIYEGDVVKLNGYGGDDNLLVEYEEDGFYGQVTVDRGYSREGMRYNGRFLRAGEVIGDIYDNPELMK